MKDIDHFPGASERASARRVQDEGHAALVHPRQLARFLCGITSPAASRAISVATPISGRWGNFLFVK